MPKMTLSLTTFINQLSLITSDTLRERKDTAPTHTHNHKVTLGKLVCVCVVCVRMCIGTLNSLLVDCLLLARLTYYFLLEFWLKVMHVIFLVATIRRDIAVNVRCPPFCLCLSNISVPKWEKITPVSKYRNWNEKWVPGWSNKMLEFSVMAWHRVLLHAI